LNGKTTRERGILVLAAIAIAVASACGLDSAGTAQEPSAASPALPRATAVRVCRPEAASLDLSLPSSLFVENDLRVAAKRSGVIAKVLVDRGARVRAGQPLALLETDVAAPELAMAEHELRLAEADYRRLQRLRGEDVVSPQDFERAEIARDLAASKVELQKAWIERCTIRAPFDGTIVERWAVPGRRVQEEDDTPLFRIVSSDSLRARVDVPEERVPGLREGSTVRVEPSGARSAVPARVVFVAPAADAASGTVPVIVEISGREGLKPGAAVQVRFDAGETAPATLFRLPREAVTSSATGSRAEGIVFVVAGGKARARRVKVIETSATATIVDGPLSVSDEVVLDPPAGLADGAAVEISRIAS
jgi:membrane fusion protein (multidrug efflux system)